MALQDERGIAPHRHSAGAARHLTSLEECVIPVAGPLESQGVPPRIHPPESLGENGQNE